MERQFGPILSGPVSQNKNSGLYLVSTGEPLVALEMRCRIIGAVHQEGESGR